ncbi:MAG: restriction endonuclease subunit S [Sedimentibacter saalensis]|jgi:type I restriction enzyme S subunit|uniref:restriction endonuclease subunit S n=1 Tax=Sedimentibacter saalensis TaxID=130788 RepID=UPI002B219A0D|nr:restriction endonuclease subunit S [Sedimentibacter saalensis]MEA5096239.1 restriction endonuclease subunit S [Sedimentibacter saalensis]
MKFIDKIKVNPTISFTKGKIYPFIEMANVDFNARSPKQINLKVYSSGVKFEKGDTVIARIEPCLQNGKGFYVNEVPCGFGSTEFLVFRPKDESIDSKFLYYYLQTDYIRKSMIASMTGATGRQRVNDNIFESLEIEMPTFSIQKRIANILSTYDDLIENNQKQIKLLDEAAMRLYKEWFVNMRFPGNENISIIDGIPEGWESKEVGSLIAKIPRTKQVKTSEYKKSGTIPIIDQSRDFISGYTEDKETIVDLGIPVIVFGDHTRILKLVNFPFAKGADGTQLIVSGTTEMPQHLLFCSLVFVDLSNYNYARHFKYLKATKIIVPSVEIAEIFENIVKPFFTEIQHLRDKILLLQKARDQLLPKLLGGEIEV